MKGCLISYKKKEETKPDLVTDREPIFEGTEEYFNKIVDLCRENDVELMVCQVPSAMDDSYEEIHRRVNSLKDICEARHVPFLDFELLRDEIQLDYSTDFHNTSHLSSYGAEKVSKYLAKYLVGHYEIPDRRGEVAYTD